MQEEVDEKTLALIISGGKISANILKNALLKVLQKMDEKNRIRETELREVKKELKVKTEAQKANRPGKRSLNSMMRDGSQLSNIEVTDSNIRSFEKVARRYGITYSLKKDRSANPPKYLVFFRAKDVDVMTAAFREYTGISIPKERKLSIRNRLRDAIARSVKRRERDKVRTREKQLER